LHTENIMQRRDGTLVIVDPWVSSQALWLNLAWSIAFASFVHGIFPRLFPDYMTKKITGSLPRYRVDKNPV
jgi:hypothetical protein